MISYIVETNLLLEAQFPCILASPGFDFARQARACRFPAQNKYQFSSYEAPEVDLP